MLSNDYRERFRAEYFQLKIRHDKLAEMTVKYEAKTLDFEPDSPLKVLNKQRKMMYEYLRCLEIRAEYEGIDLSEEE